MTDIFDRYQFFKSIKKKLIVNALSIFQQKFFVVALSIS